MDQTSCRCGCGTLIPALATNGKPRVYFQGHQNRRPKPPVPLVPCVCGCGGLLPARDPRGRPRRYLLGHQTGIPTPARLAASKRNIARARAAVDEPWNKGKTYVIAKRTVYSHRGTWMKAVRRWHGDACMRCGWADAACDAHHIVSRAKGGSNTLENAVVLCPNCHRLAHTRPEVQASLGAIKAAAVPLAEAR